MKFLTKVKLRLLISAVILFVVLFTMISYDLTAVLQLSISQIFMETFSHVGQLISFSGANILGSIIGLTTLVIFALLSVSWIYLIIIRRKWFDFIYFGVFLLVTVHTFIFISNFELYYSSRVFAGNYFIFTLFLLFITDFVLMLSISVISSYSLFVSKTNPTTSLEKNELPQNEVTVNEQTPILTMESDSESIEEEINDSETLLIRRKTTSKKKSTRISTTQLFQTTTGASADRNPLLSFAEKLKDSEKHIKELYNELKAEFLRYGLKSRLSSSCETFRYNKNIFAKITISGKSLKVYYALDPKDYKDTSIPVSTTPKKSYLDTPLIYKLSEHSNLMKAVVLVRDLCFRQRLIREEITIYNYYEETISTINS